MENVLWSFCNRSQNELRMIRPFRRGTLRGRSQGSLRRGAASRPETAVCPRHNTRLAGQRGTDMTSAEWSPDYSRELKRGQRAVKADSNRANGDRALSPPSLSFGPHYGPARSRRPVDQSWPARPVTLPQLTKRTGIMLHTAGLCPRLICTALASYSASDLNPQEAVRERGFSSSIVITLKSSSSVPSGVSSAVA